jgi:hypothetical protein
VCCIAQRKGTRRRGQPAVFPAVSARSAALPLGLFVGLRTFTVTPLDGAVECRMDLRMSGPLAWLILKSVGDRQPEVDSFSAALTARAEQAT